jgi:hypothetical protein
LSTFSTFQKGATFDFGNFPDFADFGNFLDFARSEKFSQKTAQTVEKWLELFSFSGKLSKYGLLSYL